MTATLPSWMATTGPIPRLPPDDDFWTDQPRDHHGRWAPKEKALEYAHLQQPTRIVKVGEAVRVSHDQASANIAVEAPVCRHGHFKRWAHGVDPKGNPNCVPCAEEPEPRPRRSRYAR